MTTSTTRPPADTDALLGRTLGLILEPTLNAQDLYAMRDHIASARAESTLRLADGIIVASACPRSLTRQPRCRS